MTVRTCFWHVQIRIRTGKMTALSSFPIYCLDVVKMAKLFTREMSRAPVNNCFVVFFRIRLFSSTMITGGYTVCYLHCLLNILLYIRTTMRASGDLPTAAEATIGHHWWSSATFGDFNGTDRYQLPPMLVTSGRSPNAHYIKTC